jgi:hypothetical protein
MTGVNSLHVQMSLSKKLKFSQVSNFDVIDYIEEDILWG